jgi:hypothetical protein
MSTYRLRQISTFSAALSLLLLVSASGAFAFGLRVTPIGGTASEGRGQIGDTLVVGIDAILEEGESLVAPIATLQRDLEHAFFPHGSRREYPHDRIRRPYRNLPERRDRIQQF